MKDVIAGLLSQAIEQLKAAAIIPAELTPRINIDRTRDKTHGDLASNLAMMLAKAAGKPPRDVAQLIIDHLPASDAVAKVEIAGPGFINFYLNEGAASAIVDTVLAQGDKFGCSDVGQGRQVQVEFVSANPTGPLHVGHGRGAAIGDTLCRLMTATGWKTTAEFYYNDAGNQINNLGISTQSRCRGIAPDDAGWPEDGYRGDYIKDVADAYMAAATIVAEDKKVTGLADADNLTAISEFAVAYLRREQDLDLQAFGVHFDVFSLESALYAEGKVEQVVADLVASGNTYEKDDALWLKTTDFGDDKDRVMRKSDGGYTYFVPDVAYHKEKWNRGFTRVINEQGSDHHSTITRVRAGLQALNIGIPEGWPEYVLHQMVMVMRGGEEVKLSKRAGSYITIRDLIDEVGKDATRYFLAARSPHSQLTFDIDLARSQSNDNPVYYIQYAHARVCSVMAKLEGLGWSWSEETACDLTLLTEDSERALLKRLTAFPEYIAKAASSAEPHVIANYIYDLAGEFHSCYNAHKTLVDDEPLRNARLALSAAVRQVLSNGLTLLGVSSPEKM